MYLILLLLGFAISCLHPLTHQHGLPAVHSYPRLSVRMAPLAPAPSHANHRETLGASRHRTGYHR